MGTKLGKGIQSLASKATTFSMERSKLFRSNLKKKGGLNVFSKPLKKSDLNNVLK